MSAHKYEIYIDNIWFESLYNADYYNDKPNFFAHGAKQFFTIYQILRNREFILTIVGENSADKIKISTHEEFKVWVDINYPQFSKCLDNIEWGKHPESRLK